MEWIETNNPGETFAVGRELGRMAQPGEIYTLNGGLGVGKTVFTQGSRQGWASRSMSAALLLRSYRFMRREGFPFIISMSTALAILRRWKRSVMRITFMATGSA